MSGKHQRHRAGKGNAKSLPDVKLSYCTACGKPGLVSKITGTCTGGREVNGHVRDRAAECRERAA